MLTFVKDKICETFPFHNQDFSQYINITGISKVGNTVSITLDNNFDISTKLALDTDTVFISGVYSSWVIPLNPTIDTISNAYYLSVSIIGNPYIDISSEIKYYLSGIVIKSDGILPDLTLEGEVTIIKTNKRVDSNGDLVKEFQISLKNILSLKLLKPYKDTGYTIDSTNCKLSFANLIDAKYKAYNRPVSKMELTQVGPNILSYTVNDQEGDPDIFPTANCRLSCRHRVYITTVAPSDLNVLITSHMGDDNIINNLNTMYILDNGSTALTNVNTASGQDGLGSFYMTRQATFSVFLLIPKNSTDNMNNSLFAEEADYIYNYTDILIAELQGISLGDNENYNLEDISLLTDEPVGSGNPNLYLRLLVFQSTYHVNRIRTSRKNPIPEINNIDLCIKTNSNKDIYENINTDL